MDKMKYTATAGAEFKADIYSGKNSDKHKTYIEAWCEGDTGTERLKRINFDAKRWPVGTKLIVEVPCCPGCHLDAEHQNKKGKCPECGFDWKNWAEEQYG